MHLWRILMHCFCIDIIGDDVKPTIVAPEVESYMRGILGDLSLTFPEQTNVATEK
jgi:hypothetical protein